MRRDGKGTGMPTSRPAEPLDRCRVLVVEDESLIAMDLEGMLRRAGCEVVGPVSRVEAARRRVEEDDAPSLDMALLDINLDGEMVFALADALAERRIPFVFLTGYGPEVLPERFKGRPITFKPYTQTTLLALLVEARRARGAEAS